MKEKPSEAREKPKRKLPKKSQRARRRYILFSLRPGSCKSSKQAFDLVVEQFSGSERKKLGIWFISFDQETGLGIVRCRLGNEGKVRKGIEAVAKEFSPKTVRSSGTLKALRKK